MCQALFQIVDTVSKYLKSSQWKAEELEELNQFLGKGVNLAIYITTYM